MAFDDGAYMRDILPEGVIASLRDRYLAGVADARAKFQFSRGSEDSLTGTLGSAISMPAPVIFRDGLNEYAYHVFYRRARSQGRRAPEKTYGADGIFEIQVLNQAGRSIRRKGPPFQAKIGRSSAKRPISQAQNMVQTVGQGLIIEYPAGYKAIRRPPSSNIEAKAYPQVFRATTRAGARQ